VVHMYLSAVAHVCSNDVEIQGLPCMTDGLVQHTKHVVRLHHVGDLQVCITTDARRMFVCVSERERVVNGHPCMGLHAYAYIYQHSEEMVHGQGIK
jgi:hypothetical protein